MSRCTNSRIGSPLVKENDIGSGNRSSSGSSPKSLILHCVVLPLRG
jgi:hypothetical protein